MKRILLLSLAAALGSLIGTQASAHAFLSTASPAVGSTVQASPKQVQLNFTEGLEAAFSSVAISGPSGAGSFGKPRISGTTMIIPVRGALAPGQYHVVWRATAVDTHKTQGSFDFTIGR